jgi:hypothetical protein
MTRSRLPGQSRWEKTIEKTILRDHSARTFSHSLGHSRPGPASSRSSDVRFAPKATDHRLRTACREGPRTTVCTAEKQLSFSPTSHSGYSLCCYQAIAKSRQLAEQGLSLLQIERVEAFGEPAIDRSEAKREGDDVEAINRMFAPEFRNRLDSIFPTLLIEIEVLSVRRLTSCCTCQLPTLPSLVDGAASGWLTCAGEMAQPQSVKAAMQANNPRMR